MTVYLVGAGPGDPGLITVRGADLLGRADAVVYDRLTARELLSLAPPTAELLSVGKAANGPTVPQSRINELLVDLGRRYETVVRLKGGDPFVFARGAEELAAVGAAGIACEIVPGITSAIAAPAYAGIAVTERFTSTSVTIVTGHEDPTKATTTVDWEAMARVGGTLVILMGTSRWDAISAALRRGGAPDATPVAAVHWGTTARQEALFSTLGALRAEQLTAPSTIIVGDVVDSATAWFVDRPLFAKRVALTRPRPTAQGARTLPSRLGQMGATVFECPLLAFEPPSDAGAALDQALDSLTRTEWLVFTSPQAVAAVLARLGDIRQLGSVRIAAVGHATEAALRAARLGVELVPNEANAAGLVDALGPAPTSGLRVLHPTSDLGGTTLSEGLHAHGWSVRTVEAYRTVDTEPVVELADRLIESDAVVLYSPSSVRSLAAWHGTRPLTAVPVAVGGTTAAEVTAVFGVSAVVAEEPTDEAICLALHHALVRTA